jgi:hypothetical protein
MLRIILKLLILIVVVTSSCKKEPTNQTPSNKPPVAKAGLDQTIHIPDTETILDGSASYDHESTISSFAWRKINGADVSMLLYNNLMGVDVKYMKEGVFQFELKVTDPEGLASMDTVKVTVIDDFAIGKLPVVTFLCETKTLAVPNTSIFIPGSAYVQNDNNIRYEFWEGISASQISGPSQAILKISKNDSGLAGITAENLSSGIYFFKIDVERKGLKNSDTASVRVINDTLTGKEYLFETRWQKDDITGAVVAKTPEQPDLFYNNGLRKTEVWIKNEGADWVQIDLDPFDYTNNFYYSLGNCETRLQIFTNIFPATSLIEKKLSIRVRYSQ